MSCHQPERLQCRTRIHFQGGKWKIRNFFSLLLPDQTLGSSCSWVRKSGLLQMNNSCVWQTHCPFFSFIKFGLGGCHQHLLSFNTQNSPILTLTQWQFLSSPVWTITQFAGKREIFSSSTSIWLLQYCTSTASVSALFYFIFLFAAPTKFHGHCCVFTMISRHGQVPKWKKSQIYV